MNICCSADFFVVPSYDIAHIISRRLVRQYLLLVHEAVGRISASSRIALLTCKCRECLVCSWARVASCILYVMTKPVQSGVFSFCHRSEERYPKMVLGGLHVRKTSEGTLIMMRSSLMQHMAITELSTRRISLLASENVARKRWIGYLQTQTGDPKSENTEQSKLPRSTSSRGSRSTIETGRCCAGESWVSLSRKVTCAIEPTAGGLPR